MITYNFDRLFKARGINKPFSFLKRAGLSDSFASRVKNNRVSRLDLKMIERLCLLLRCSPNDIMEWVPDNETEVDKDHPINAIRKSDKVIDITKTLNSVPLDKLDDIEELIKKYISTTTNTP